MACLNLNPATTLHSDGEMIATLEKYTVLSVLYIATKIGLVRENMLMDQKCSDKLFGEMEFTVERRGQAFVPISTLNRLPRAAAE